MLKFTSIYANDVVATLTGEDFSFRSPNFPARFDRPDAYKNAYWTNLIKTFKMST